MTLTGPPGVGKTRMAVQLANRLWNSYPDGIWMVELAELDEPSLAASAVARALGVREIDRAPTDALLDELRTRELLLLLDNCEHLLDACTELAEALLKGCSGVRILATSRQALGLTGGIAWQVPSLTLPEPADPVSGPASDGRAPGGRRVDADALRAVQASEAGQLFVERARASRASFELTEADAAAAAEICRRVDGVPLAIELAAARIAHLAPQQIADRLDDRFRLLAGGRSAQSPRHQTLRSLVDWSHDLLSEPERVVFRRMAVFAGGWTLEAAEAIVGFGFRVSGLGGENRVSAASVSERTVSPETRNLEPDTLDLLAQLVDKSLVLVAEQPAALRYSFHETIRQYALERLDASGEGPEIRRLHAEYYVTLAEELAPRLFGTELQPLLDVLDREHDNMSLALRWSSQATESDIGPRLAGALWRFWQVRGYLREGRTWLERLLSTAMPAAPTRARARALNAIGFVTFLQGDYETGRPLLAESVEIWRALDDHAGLVEALTNLGVLLRCIGDWVGARRTLNEALAVSRLLGDRAWEGRTLNKLARLTFYEGDLAAARTLHETSIVAVREAGNAWDVAIALGDLADVSHVLGDDAATRQHYAESLRLWVDLGDERGVAQGLEGFAILAAADARPERAVRLIAAARAIRERITEPSSPSRRAILDRLLEDARAALGTVYDAAWEAGYTAPPAEAVAAALADQRAGPEVGRPPARPTVTSPALPPDTPDAPVPPAEPSLLTDREHDVMVRLARGLTNRRIADELIVSERTVEWHVSKILSRLKLRSRSQLAVWARERGIVPDE